MSNNMVLKLMLNATDKMSGVVKGAVAKSQKQFKDLKQNINDTANLFNNIGKKAVVCGAALLAISAGGVKMAADFEGSMSSVTTLIDTNVESVQTMNKEVLGIAKRTPVALNELTGALYDIRSAGMSASEQFNILEKSAQLAVAGLGTTKEAVNLVTTSINAWNLKGKEADKVYNTIFSAVKYGKTTISELAQGFGGVTATVTGANIKFDEYIASVTALTTVGIPASQAHTMLKAAIAGMTRETKESRKILNQYGAKDFKDLVVKSGGLVGALQRVTRSVKGNDAAILQILGSTEAFSAAQSVCGATNEAYNKTLAAMRSNSSNALDGAYIKKLETVNAQLQRAQNFVQKIGIDFGSALLPPFKKFLDLSEKVLNKIDSLPEGVKNSMMRTTAGLGIGITAFGGLSLASGLAVKGLGTYLDAYRNIAEFMSKNKIYMEPLKFTISAKGTAAQFNNIKNSIKGFSSNISNAAANTLLFSKTAAIGTFTFFKNLPANIAKSGRAIGGLGNPLKAAKAAFMQFNMVVSANPIGVVAGIIAVAALLIYKYWKPVAAFFRGFWRGVVEGTKPLHPAFKRIAQAVKPLVGWCKKLVTPINTAGKASENFGYKAGKFIGGLITDVGKLIKKMTELAQKFNPRNYHFQGGKFVFEEPKTNKQPKINSVQKVKTDGSHAGGLDRVPFDGYVAELHKDEGILTAEQNKSLKKGMASKSSFILNYAPTINMDAIKDTKELEKLLKKHAEDIMRRFKQEKKRLEARAYA